LFIIQKQANLRLEISCHEAIGLVQLSSKNTFSRFDIVLGAWKTVLYTQTQGKQIPPLKQGD